MYPIFQHTETSDQIPVNIPLPIGGVGGTTSYLESNSNSTAGQITTSSTTGIENRQTFAIYIIDPNAKEYTHI